MRQNAIVIETATGGLSTQVAQSHVLFLVNRGYITRTADPDTYLLCPGKTIDEVEKATKNLPVIA